MAAIGNLSLSLWLDNMAVMVSLLLYLQVGFKEALWKSIPHKYSYDVQKQGPKLKKIHKIKAFTEILKIEIPFCYLFNKLILSIPLSICNMLEAEQFYLSLLTIPSFFSYPLIISEMHIFSFNLKKVSFSKLRRLTIYTGILYFLCQHTN